MMYRPEQNFPAQDNPEHRIPQFAGDIFDFHRLANLLRAKAWIIAAVACVIFVAAVAYIIWAPIYESRAVIQVQQEAQKVVNIADVSEEKPETNDYLNTVVQAFTSRKLMLRVIRSTGLDKDPALCSTEEGWLALYAKSNLQTACPKKWMFRCAAIRVLLILQSRTLIPKWRKCLP